MFLNGKWLESEERRDRISLLKERLRKLVELHKLGKASDHHIDMIMQDKKELEMLQRVERGEHDVAYFTFEFLSDLHNPENEDNIIRNGDDGTPMEPLEHMAPIHREFFDLADEINENRGTNLAIAAPRGHSKSGIFSNAFVLHQIVYRKQAYTLIISETDNLSKKLISWANKQLKYNTKLRDHFGELLSPNTNKNEKDNEEAFITSTNALVEASSAGKQLRGKRHGALRPTLVLIDDPSSTNNEGTAEARQKLISWFNSVVVPIGTKTTSIVLVGTMVTATGLLSHVLKRRDFKSSFHDAIVSEPDYPELWDEYLEIYSRDESGEEAEEFYKKNEKLLNSGVKTAWEWRWTYRALMHAKVNMGTKDFNSEFRNRAYSEDEQFFRMEEAAYYTYRHNMFDEPIVVYDGKEFRLRDMTISGAWDIAMGKNARSCFNAFVTVGRHEASGYLFVLDEYSSREAPHKFIEKIVARLHRFKHNVVSVETINAQHEFYRQLMEIVRAEGLYSTRVQDVKGHKSSKEQRIESLEPMVANKTLVFNEHHRTLIEQLESYPNGDYVDSADALQMAVENVARPKRNIFDKPPWL